MTQPTGTMSWCCVARENIKNENGHSMIIDKNNGSMKAAWNSTHMKKVREQMYNGEEVKRSEEHTSELQSQR